MNTQVMRVFTGKSYETMIAEGGSGHWRAKRESILDCSYSVAVKNQHSEWSEGTEDHGTAFLIGHIVGVTTSTDRRFTGRFIIVFDRFATLNIPNSWPPRTQNPVSYTDLETLKIDLRKLNWQDFRLASQFFVPLRPLSDSMPRQSLV